ncbi:MAG: hypothetical protein BM563_02795 [Bacteroidetes bacterium MedPE-SWsnd-G1]|nr:MAG: hypothetical protein BM563_02795 [Bacteroidetes bacterium MedPE-SWsnd-G1]
MLKQLLLFVFSFSITLSYGNNFKSDLIKPPSLKKGDTILIVAPAGKLKNLEAIQAGIDLAEQWGLVVKLGKYVLGESSSFSGTDQERLDDFQKGLDNPNIKMIWAGRGGYGAVRIIDDLDFTTFKKHPKWVVGYSDITVLHNKLHALGYQSIHAQMPSTLDLKDPIQEPSIQSLYQVLFGKKLKYSLEGNGNNRIGKRRGTLVGGNLSILYSMLGSDTDLDTTGKIIFIEDVGEYLYHIDRMLISLKRAGYFEKAAGLIVGDFRLKTNDSNPFGKTLQEVVFEAIEGTDFPVIFDFPAGHIDDNRTLVFGSDVKLNVTKNESKLSF